MEITPELVVERVRAAGGRLVLTNLEPDELAAWRRASKAAYLRLLRAGHERLERSGQPGTLRLVLKRLDEKPTPPDPAQLAALRKAPEPVLPRTGEFVDRVVPAPSKVANPHPIAEELVQSLDRLDRFLYGADFSWRAPRPGYPLVKMRRIWQALIKEAAFRGYTVRFSLDHRDRYDRGQLVIEIGRDEFPIVLYGDRKHTLTLTIKQRHPNRRRGYDSWAEAPDRPLHTRLGEVFTHIERWADLLIQQREKERQRERDARRRREQIEAAARSRYVEEDRRTVLARRIAEADFADDARAYSAALAAAADRLPLPRADDVRAWAHWVGEHADRIDPRRKLKGMPAEPNPSRDDLKPFLPNNGLWY
ncbi:hypothetical protein [Actinoplanes flavus]|uniref:Uncharacterized protein n=1 Tax=Actinoplanes flavus TaxID=2820290 RepID=A0ABS3UH67_9ACTN|nr:hypothetical protein [Actinoplanes flavus]MBO3738125.1 hypothetical protein [Actinoplanes flavus]